MNHKHHAALRALVEVVVSQADIVVERWLKFGVTGDDVERIGLVGHRLQLGQRWLSAARAIVNREATRLAELVAESREGSQAPGPACGDGAVAIEFVVALRHRGLRPHAHVEVVLPGHLLEPYAELLVKECVGELVAKRLVESLGIVVVEVEDLLVGRAVAIVGAIGEIDKPSVLHIAQRLGPCEPAQEANGLAQVVVDAIDELFALGGVGFQEISVERVRVAVLVHVVISHSHHGAEATSGSALEIVVIYHVEAGLVALAIVVIRAGAVVDQGSGDVAGASLAILNLVAVAEIERESGSNLERIERVGLPLDAEVTAHVVPLVARQSGRLVV